MDTLVQFLSSIFDGLKSIGSALQWVWQHIVKWLLISVCNIIIDIHHWLEDHTKGLRDLLHKIRDRLDRYWKLYVLPILKLIQHCRQFLMILRLMGVKWAQKLDAYLVQLQAKITSIFLTVKGTLNAVIDVVNALSDPPRLVRWIAASVAGRRSAAALCRMWTGLPLGMFLPYTGADAYPWEQPVMTSADVMDPDKNPPVSVILNGLLPSSLLSFMDTDPSPSDAEVDQAQPLPYYANAMQALLAASAAADSSVDLPFDYVISLTTGQGVRAQMWNALAGVCGTQWGDILE
jgi:hypothetical protein